MVLVNSSKPSSKDKFNLKIWQLNTVSVAQANKEVTLDISDQVRCNKLLSKPHMLCKLDR